MLEYVSISLDEKVIKAVRLCVCVCVYIMNREKPTKSQPPAPTRGGETGGKIGTKKDYLVQVD